LGTWKGHNAVITRLKTGQLWFSSDKMVVGKSGDFHGGLDG
jgi:hypothetical protein